MDESLYRLFKIFKKITPKKKQLKDEEEERWEETNCYPGATIRDWRFKYFPTWEWVDPAFNVFIVKNIRNNLTRRLYFRFFPNLISRKIKGSQVKKKKNKKKSIIQELIFFLTANLRNGLIYI